jgi:hypothetical protein
MSAAGQPGAGQIEVMVMAAWGTPCRLFRYADHIHHSGEILRMASLSNVLRTGLLIVLLLFPLWLGVQAQ